MIFNAPSIVSRRLVLHTSVAAFFVFTLPTIASAQFDSPTGASEEAAAEESDAMPDQAAEIVPRVDVEPTADDEQIRERIAEILDASHWFTAMNVEVDEGLVFLEGETKSQKHRTWAGNISRSVQDVVAVVNDITIAEQEAFDLDKASGHVSQSLLSLWRDFLSRLPLIVVGLVILALTWMIDYVAAIAVRRSAQRARLRASLQDLLAQLSTFVTWVLGLMIAAVVVFPGMTPARLLTVLGLGSVALGFAFKDIFENFFAGILILWRFPFDKGDFIECNGLQGKIEEITIRMSQIRQVDGQLVVVPNAVLFKNPVNVLTSEDLRRTTVICGVAYGEDVDEAREVIEAAVRDCPTVAGSKPVEIFAREFAASSINFEVTWWTGSTPLEIRRSCDQVVAAVKRALDRADIEIPFPYRTLTFKQPLAVSGNLLPSGDALEDSSATASDSASD